MNNRRGRRPRIGKVRHHEIFSRFRKWTGTVPPGIVADFLGTKTRTSYYTPENLAPVAREESPALPDFDEEYFEWIDLLEAAAAAKGRFTMMELGAGWGRWTARAAAAATQLGLPYTLVAVEAEPTHFQWLKESLKENGVRMEDCRMVQAAVTAKDGTVGFHVGDPNSYGQMLGGPVEIAAVSLPTLLAPLELVDLIDMDVQCAELEILQASREIVERVVKRIHVETHSHKLHLGVAKLFRELGWRCHCSFEGNTRDDTVFGRINFQSGVQSWLNPALNTPEQLRALHTYRNSFGFRGLQAGKGILDRVAPLGTRRRKLARALFSSLPAKFRRDPGDERKRPTAW